MLCPSVTTKDPANTDCSAPAKISGASARDDQGLPSHPSSIYHLASKSAKFSLVFSKYFAAANELLIGDLINSVFQDKVFNFACIVCFIEFA